MPRTKGNTKEKIIEKSLKLFSEHGYEAVSIRTIADEVGIGNSALYKHFRSKQEIFDSIVEKSKEKYLEKCFETTDKIDGYEKLKQNCIDMFLYQTTDEWIVRFRQILLLEKFHNKKMAEIYKEFFVDMPLNSQMKLFDTLQKQGIMISGDTKVYAMELFAPFYLYHFVEYEKEELIPLYEKHVTSFFKEHFMESKGGF
ncbi:MAG: TetR/AcrR family transcriptional regulator [Roseburia sp.]